MNQIKFKLAAKQVDDIDELIVDAYNKLLEENHYLKSVVASLSERPMAMQASAPSPSRREQELLEKNVALETELRELREYRKHATELLDHDKIMEMAFDQFENNTTHWVKSTFGEQSMASKRERALRFLEKALELAQACGLNEADVERMLGYVYGRAPGTPQEEIGGVLMTLFSLAEHFNLSAGVIANDTLKSCWQRQDKIREKHWQKPTHLLGVTRES